MAISKIAVTTVNKESNMKSNAFKILLLSSAIAGMSGTASAQTFTATATVQNAVNITQTTALNFGTVFASKTSADAAPAATSSDKLTLAPLTGAISRTAAVALDTDVAAAALSLGGGVAGVFTAPGLPTNATVKVILKDAAGTAITNAATVAAAACNYDTKVAAIAANKVVLSISEDPSAGFFCVDAFTNDKNATLFTTGYAIGFSATTLDFNLGATLVQQAVTGAAPAQLAYNPGAYSGSFGMEITFP